MIVLIPMAGAGSRFSEAGYSLPKPLLPIQNQPMILQAAKSLPKAEKYAFLVRTAHENSYAVKEVLGNAFDHPAVIPVETLTEGQACTCLLAKDYLDLEESWLIGASDNGMIFSEETFEQLTVHFDALIFTFKGHAAVVEKPEAYGWVCTNEKQEALRVSVKKPISDTPIKDHAVVGAFWFKKGKYFVEAAEKMIAENRRINGEFYVDECLNDLISAGKKVGVFLIDHYVGWGTPKDYEAFRYWDHYFEKYPPLA